MPWSTHTFSLETGFAVDTEFDSPVYLNQSEYGPSFNATITDNDSQTSSLQLYLSLDGNTWTAYGSALTASGVVDLSGVRVSYFKWGFKNTTASPGGHSNCTVNFSGWVDAKTGSIEATTVPVSYISGDFSVARQIYSGKSNLMLVGDSICNDQNGGASGSAGSQKVYKSFYYGILSSWRPVRWAQYHIPHVVGGQTATRMGFYNGNISADNSRPNEPFDGLWSGLDSSLHSCSPHSVRLVRCSAAISSASRVTGVGIRKEIWSATAGDFYEGLDYRPLTDADGNQNFLNDTERYVARFMMAVSAEETEADLPYSGLSLRITRRDSATYTQAGVNLSSFLPEEGSALGYVDSDFTNATGSQDMIFDIMGGSKAITGAKVIHPGVCVRREGVEGFGLSYIGQGGWDLTNHSLLPGDPGITDLSDGYPGAYTDKALRDWIQAQDSNIYMLYLGQNDERIYSAGSPDIDGAMEDFKNIVQRIRNAHSVLGKEEPMFVVLTVACNTEGASGSDSAANRRQFSERQIEYASYQTGMLAIDMDGWIRSQFDQGDFGVGENDYRAKWTEDGVHPSSFLGDLANDYDGADQMMSWVWERILEAAGVS